MKHVTRNPSVSLSLYEGVDFAIIIHGTARVIGPDEAGFEPLIEWQRALSNGRCVLDWGPREQAAFLVVDPDVMFTFARHPEDFEP